MSQHNRNERISRQQDPEQPEGWFDPEHYRSNRESYSQNRNSGNSRQNTGYGNMEGRRSGNQYGNRNNYGHSQFDNRSNVNSRGYNNDPNDQYNRNPSHRPFYGDNFEWETRVMNQNDQYNLRNSSGDDSDRYRAYPGNPSSNRNNRDNRDNREDRDWWDRASDEVASWFGDDDAERRRRSDKINGPHRGKGPKGFSRTDERVTDDINHRLYDDPFIDASDVEVKVENGEAVLTGTVDSREAKRRVEDLVESITGVKDVENRIKVKNNSSSQFNDTGERTSGEGSSWTR